MAIIRRRIALDQVQAELAVRAGALIQKSASSSNDSACWGLATDVLHETAVDDER